MLSDSSWNVRAHQLKVYLLYGRRKSAVNFTVPASTCKVVIDLVWTLITGPKSSTLTDVRHFWDVACSQTSWQQRARWMTRRLTFCRWLWVQLTRLSFKAPPRRTEGIITTELACPSLLHTQGWLRWPSCLASEPVLHILPPRQMHFITLAK